MNNFRKFEKNHYPMDSAIHLSYNQPLLRTMMLRNNCVVNLSCTVFNDNIAALRSLLAIG